MRISKTFILLSLFLLSSCSLFSPITLDTKKFLLDKIPTQFPPKPTHAPTIVVLKPETKAVYNTTQMAYSVQPHQIDFFSKNEWGETPAQMLQPLLIETLQKTHYFHAVVTPSTLTNNAYFLKTQILELNQDYTVNPAILRLTLLVQIYQAATNQVIASKEFSISEPIVQKTPYGGVIAANCATRKMLREIALLVSRTV